MTAPQNSWAHPLGKTLVDAFRETQFWYIQKNTAKPSYDPATGKVDTVPPTIWHCGAAVVKNSPAVRLLVNTPFDSSKYA